MISAFPYWFLFREMTAAEFKLRDQGTVLGFLWTLLQPALMFAVLYLLFVNWIGRHVGDYGAYLIVGLVFWSFFQKATSVGLSSLKRRSALVRNYRFPREIIVFSAVGAVFLPFVLECVVMAAALLLLGVAPSWSWLAAPFFILVLLLVVAGLSLMLAVLAAGFRDAERIWEVLTAALFYLTPVFYPLRMLEESKRRLLSFNPLAALIGGVRECLIDGRFPAPAQAAWLAAMGLGLLVLGVLLLRSIEGRVADTLASGR